MFTGLVQATARLLRLDPSPAGVRLVLDASAWDHAPALGDSICVSGVCLTLAAQSAPGHLAFDVIPETLRRTTLGARTPGDLLNLECSATPTTLLGGHIVQGHVDALGEVVSVSRGSEHRIRVRPAAEAMEYLTPKGSITIEGVSLTVAAVDVGAGTFEVALIPVTLERSTLGTLDAGARVNLETDVLARTLVHWARHYGVKKPT